MPAVPAPSPFKLIDLPVPPAALSAQAQGDAARAAPAVIYRLTADSDPSILSRALECVLRRGAAPTAVDARLDAAGWRIALTVAGVTAAESAHIALTLAQIVGVGAVVTEEAAG